MLKLSPQEFTIKIFSEQRQQLKENRRDWKEINSSKSLSLCVCVAHWQLKVICVSDTITSNVHTQKHIHTCQSAPLLRKLHVLPGKRELLVYKNRTYTSKMACVCVSGSFTWSFWIVKISQKNRIPVNYCNIQNKWKICLNFKVWIWSKA